MKIHASLHKKYLRNWCVTAFIFWSVLVLGSIVFFIKTEWQSAMSTGRELGIAALQKDYTYRAWNAMHGGVYVPATQLTPPSPFLSHIPNRDISTAEGNALTLMNPAYMTRQVHELGWKLYGLRAHITSLNVIRPQNKADQWEENALQQFEDGAEEVAELVIMDDLPFMRVMTPMKTWESCLKCHAIQGYKVSDIRGGTSVSVPMQGLISTAKKRIFVNSFYHLLIFLVGAVGLFIFCVQTNKQFTGRTEAENALKKQEKHLQGIVDNISNGIAVYERSEKDDDFIIKSINPAGLQNAQLELEDVVGKKVTEVFPAFIEMGLFAVFQRVWDTGEPEHLPVTAYSDKRISLWMENYVYKLPDGAIVAVYNDVTIRKHSEEQLLRKAEEWEKTFDAIPDIITLQDKNMKIIRANQATFDFFQMEPEELLGATCYSLFRQTTEPCEGCPGLATLADTKKHTNIIEHPSLGKSFHVCSAPVLDQDNKVQYFVYVAQDITEKKRLEGELFQAQKMEAIGTLAGGIAHDFNNILSAIVGYAELAKAKLPKTSQVVFDIDQVITAGERATELVRQILTFSRKANQQKKPLRIDLIINEALKLLRSSLPTTIDIQASIDKEASLVLADPTSIHQIVVNLCTNASHAIGNEKGELKVTLGRVYLEPEQIADKSKVQTGSFVVLTVQDDGKGMDGKTVARIFEPYFTTKKQGKGTGLGLAMIHGIVEEYNGFIEVKSAPGKGTTFQVYLPAMEEKRMVITDEENYSPLPTGNENILFIDDELAIVNSSRSILTSLGYNVTAETKSTKALVKFQASTGAFDLVITDQTMPDVTGVELAQVMLQQRPDLPIILCTGYTSAISEDEVYAIGIKSFVIKPLKTRMLAETVRRVLDENLMI